MRLAGNTYSYKSHIESKDGFLPYDLEYYSLKGPVPGDSGGLGFLQFLAPLAAGIFGAGSAIASAAVPVITGAASAVTGAIASVAPMIVSTLPRLASGGIISAGSMMAAPVLQAGGGIIAPSRPSSLQQASTTLWDVVRDLGAGGLGVWQEYQRRKAEEAALQTVQSLQPGNNPYSYFPGSGQITPSASVIPGLGIPSWTLAVGAGLIGVYFLTRGKKKRG